MSYEKYKSMPNAKIPGDIAQTLTTGGSIQLTQFNNVNDIIADKSLWLQTGFTQDKNGNLFVSMYCPMENVTSEMIDWWFWWHPQDNDRYRLWFPGEHFSIRTDKKNADYFGAKEQPQFRPNTQYPTEKIGSMRMPLRIDFLTPQEFGLDEALMKEQNVATVVCGHVGALGGLVYHTEMMHVWFNQDNGLFMISRFWIGNLLKNPLLRKAILTEDTARGMAQHCCVEYRNLARKLPELYKEYSGK